MTNSIILLGTKGGPALRQGGALPTSSLLQMSGKSIVIDCGIGVTTALVQSGADLRNFDAICITHLHSDHLLELGPLIHTAWTTGRTAPLTVFGPVGVRAYWRAFRESMSFDNNIRVQDEGRIPLETLVTVIEYGPGTVAQLGDINITALRVEHPPVEDTFALRFSADGKTAVFSADTAYFPPLATFAKGCDVLVHEAMLAPGVETIIQRTGLGEKLRQHLYNSHTLAEDAAKIARDAGTKHLVFNHLIPADDPDFGDDNWRAAVVPFWQGRLTIGRDGAKIDF